MIRARLLALAAPLLLLGCRLGQPDMAPRPHYVVGAPYQAGGVWYYPREDFQFDATGLAAVLPDRTGLTADGEAFDGAAVAAAHPGLQLPSVALVTDLETGLQAVVRVNDRGPVDPARLIGLTRGAAERLGVASSGVARVRVRVLSGPSQALRDQLGGDDGHTTPAPLTKVTSVSLAPPQGVEQSAHVRAASAAALDEAARPAAAFTLQDAAERVAPAPGQLWIRAGEFSLARYADEVRAKLGGSVAVEASRQGRSETFRVRAGPYPDVAAADMALDQARRAGVTDAHIVVE